MSDTAMRDDDVVAAIESVMRHKAEDPYASGESDTASDESLLAGWRSQQAASAQAPVTVVKC